MKVVFKKGTATVYNGKVVVMTATRVDDVYPIHMQIKVFADHTIAITLQPSNLLELWHLHIGHISADKIKC